ncbi:MAG TPA: ATP-binding protein, partial [Phycisphaerae bacterium]|nr:ATP-binding protein [Phycisphaerae bacterium]
HIRIIYDLISEISSIFSTPLLLRKTLDKVFEVLKADRGYIMLIDERGEVSVAAARHSEEIADEKIPISRTIINEVMSKQVGVLCSNAMSDKRFTSGKSVHDFGIRSAVCVPISGRERIIGVLHVDCSVSEHTYSTEQLRLLTAIGYQTGLAIENVKLHESAVQSERLAAAGETVAFLSHHIKNILHALGAGIELVEAGVQHDDLAKAKGAWPIVQRNLERINGLILNMLAFSKSREPLLENVNVNHVLNECIELVSRHADELGVTVMSDLDDVPPIPADSAGLNQAFLNLIQNALEAVEPGTGVVTVASKYDSMNRNVIVRVIDNGSGIPAEQLPRIFTPFYSSKGHKGTGLGLAVAKKVFQEHHGTIEASSKVNEGTTFTVTLPTLSARGGLDETYVSRTP